MLIQGKSERAQCRFGFYVFALQDARGNVYIKLTDNKHSLPLVKAPLSEVVDGRDACVSDT